jgi:CheY-like chemotaxis protein
MATVLVVDDDPISRDFLRTLLGYRGHQICEAADGDTALRLAERRALDAVITDVLMPKLDGYELARLLRRRPATSHLPIAFSTAHYAHDEIEPMARACGVRDVIFKPAQPAAVLATIDALVSRPTLPVQWERHAAFVADRLAETHQLTGAGTWDLDPDSGVIVLSAGLRDLLRLPTAGVRPDQLRERVHPEDLTRLAMMAGRTWRTGMPGRAEIRVADMDGAVHELIVSCRMQKYTRTVWGVAHDVTEIRRIRRDHLRAEADRLAEHRVVESFHQAVLRDLPEIAGVDLGAVYLTAPERLDVGAGWYDVRPIADGRVLLSVGRVAGHDRPAAALAPVVAVLRACVADDADPDPVRLLTRLNRLAPDVLPGGGDAYVTAVLAIYDPATGRLRVANAGHPAPVVISDRGAGVLPWRGPALGILPDAEFAGHSLTLGPDSVLCAYLHGLGDGRRMRQAFRGVDRSPRAQELAELIVHEMLGGDPPDDDICVAVLRHA